MIARWKSGEARDPSVANARMFDRQHDERHQYGQGGGGADQGERQIAYKGYTKELHKQQNELNS